jgi:putative transposase
MIGVINAVCHPYFGCGSAAVAYGRHSCNIAGGFKSPAIEAEPYLLSCGRYIERNPVAANLVAHAWEYRWSSCRAYALGESDALLAVNPWYEQLAVEPARREVLWRDFLEGEDPKEEVLAADDWAIGEPGFRRTLYRPQSRAVPRFNGRPAPSREINPDQ